MTIREFESIAMEEILDRAEKLKAQYGRELTEDDKLYCLTEAMKTPRLKEATALIGEDKTRFATGEIVHNWIGIKD